MRLLNFLLKVSMLIFAIPLFLVKWAELFWQVIFWKKMTLMLNKPFKIGERLIIDGTDIRVRVYFVRKQKRAPCPDWYKTYVVINPKQFNHEKGTKRSGN